ncbi:MAG: hypothetical protein KME57_02110 [Scytonema hyalinum WJT4-NPBG1]|nr:hypothetical protein [Scytonema hyalinum WJT4-NPBG1]
MKQSKTRRRRGIVLIPIGLKRLQAGILAMEMAQNNGDRFSLNELADLSTKTLSRLWSLDTGVDQKTLRLCCKCYISQQLGKLPSAATGLCGSQGVMTIHSFCGICREFLT